MITVLTIYLCYLAIRALAHIAYFDAHSELWNAMARDTDQHEPKWLDISQRFAAKAVLGTVIAGPFLQRFGIIQAHTPAMIYRVILVAIATVGLSLQFYAHIALAEHWSTDLALRRDHQLIKIGPYKYVRHPMYTAALLIFGSMSALCGAPFNFPLLLFIGLSISRIPHEECLLLRRFEYEYLVYTETTGALLPKWRK